jgi:carboxylesterase type B
LFAELRSNYSPFSSAVNVGYRLGAFGFMASEALTAEGQHANAALLDMRMAFEWVQANINQ